MGRLARLIEEPVALQTPCTSRVAHSARGTAQLFGLEFVGRARRFTFIQALDLSARCRKLAAAESVTFDLPIAIPQLKVGHARPQT
jgi:hypothetical protein